jgi:hypothetical protein
VPGQKRHAGCVDLKDPVDDIERDFVAGIMGGGMVVLDPVDDEFHHRLAPEKLLDALGGESSEPDVHRFVPGSPIMGEYQKSAGQETQEEDTDAKFVDFYGRAGNIF